MWVPIWCTGVSIRPPPFGRGKRGGGSNTGGTGGFQSAPRLSEGGNSRPEERRSLRPSFNPPPAFRKGETLDLISLPSGSLVSIRPPPFGRGKRGRAVGCDRGLAVSIRPPPFGRGKLAGKVNINQTPFGFNPPPAFRKGETRWYDVNPSN